MKKPWPWAKKRLGQHFLHDRGTVNRIIGLLAVGTGDQILEIGPGPGSLTGPLSELLPAFKAIELDGDLCDYLRAQPFADQVELVQADIRQVDVGRLFTGPFKIISNLPYNLSVPITAQLLRSAPRIPRMVLMYQKEVADRIAAPAGTRDYGMISVICQAMYHIGKGFKVPPGAFVPPPKVTSKVLDFSLKPEPLLQPDDLELAEALLALLFSKRRKMIGTILKHAQQARHKQPASVTQAKPGPLPPASLVLETCLQAGLDPSKRPEQLRPEDYAVWLSHLKGVV